MKKNYGFIRTLVLGFILINYTIETSGQISLKYIQGEKTQYSIGDSIKISITLSVTPETCIDGLNQTRLYQSGLLISEQSHWCEIQKGYWQKEILIRIMGSKKDAAVLTIMRRTDKQSFSKQIKFIYIK